MRVADKHAADGAAAASARCEHPYPGRQAPPIWVGWVAPVFTCAGAGCLPSSCGGAADGGGDAGGGGQPRDYRSRGGPPGSSHRSAARPCRGRSTGCVEGAPCSASSFPRDRVVLVAPRRTPRASSRVAAQTPICAPGSRPTATVSTSIHGHRLDQPRGRGRRCRLGAASAAAPAAAAAPLARHPGGVMEVVAEVEPARGQSRGGGLSEPFFVPHGFS